VPQVTVIIPARNALAWLPDAIASIGPGPSVEIIVTDDGSDDGTAEYLAGLAARDPRLVVMAGPRKGPSPARNVALERVRAPLVAFLDADDRWCPGKLATQLALHAAHPEIGFSFTDYRHLTPESEDRGACFAFWPCFAARNGWRTEAFLLPDAFAHIYAENVVGTSTVIARTDLLREVGGFRTSLGSAEDWDLWLKLASRAPVGCVPRVLCDYLMQRSGSVSKNTGRRAGAMRAVAGPYRPHLVEKEPWAVGACESRLLVAEAEARAGTSLLSALWFRLLALTLTPSLRNAREAAHVVATSIPGTGGPSRRR
jgi:glycosyltransferase involved in cell wall biosynthesis